MWDERKVAQVFTLEDGQQNLDCSIAKVNEDRIIWGHHSTGTYTTRIGHHWLLDKEEMRTVESKLWKAIPKLHVVQKIHIFGWRLGRGALPVGNKIKATRTGEGISKMCGKCIETVLHAARECPSVQEFFNSPAVEYLEPKESLDARQSAHSGKVSIGICPGRAWRVQTEQ
ncbi:hypothetical protein V6N13_081690 [Hibiscus sabdariffa]|uniref:Reverse transcriptase zinc-binding domain-containing protein n=1 Tax=Hibiscus sabdariffa TaxID=183260 RepID=A0ABR2DCT2_9ROSI